MIDQRIAECLRELDASLSECRQATSAMSSFTLNRLDYREPERSEREQAAWDAIKAANTRADRAHVELDAALGGRL